MMDFVAIGTALGGLAVGVGGAVAAYQRRQATADRTPRVVPLNGTKCTDHPGICEKVALIPTLHESIRDFREEFRGFAREIKADTGELFGVVRRHERVIGRLEGTMDKFDDDTKSMNRGGKGE